MNLQPAALEAALAQANEVSDHYNLNHLTGHDPMRVVDYILDSCAALGVGPVSIYEADIPYEQSAVYSMVVMNNDGSSDIVLARDLNHCWRRYTVCKELFHILIDREEYRNIDVFTHTESVSVDFKLDDSSPEPAVAAEMLCEIATMEFMFPYRARELILGSAQPPDYRAIAIQYRIPQILVDRYLSKLRMDPLKAFSRRA